ncbi:MAG TPA: SEC-C metal-binding domain-containing protein, partial [Streptosporangiaceae bacterium]|nr:SEC-C metal-binding domain-containing protein [Streptosporangiaceae bacterium]
GLSPVETPEDFEAAWPEAVDKAKRAVAEEHEEVVAAGGLYVLGTERHESRRIDNQLRGRSGRQGDPGESRFYLSLEDDLMRMFNAEKVAHFMEWLKTPPDVPIESKAVTRSIRSAQTQVESQNFEIRKDLLKYDDVMNRQRHVVYDERTKVLEGADMQEQVRTMIDEVVAGYVSAATSEGFPEEWDLDQLWRAFRQLYPGGITQEEAIEQAGGDRSGLSGEFLTELVQEDAQAAYDRREAELTPEVMRELERRVVLSVLDRKWREHLYEMDYLRDGIGLRAWAQRDPLVEYQREGYDMFAEMMAGIKEESVGSLFNLQVQLQEPTVEEATPAAPVGPAIPAVGGPGRGQPRGRHAAGNGARPAGPAQPDQAPAQSGQRGAGQQRRAGQQRSGRPAAGDGPVQPEQAAGQSSIPAGLARPAQRPGRLQYSAPSEDGSGRSEQRSRSAGSGSPSSGGAARVGRNDLCPCGSGRKYKRCHGDPRNQGT